MLSTQSCYHPFWISWYQLTIIFAETAAESHWLFVEHASNETTCEDWFKRFRSCDFNIQDKKRLGKSKEFQDTEWKAWWKSMSNAWRVVRIIACWSNNCWNIFTQRSKWGTAWTDWKTIRKAFNYLWMFLERYKKNFYIEFVFDENEIHYHNSKWRKVKVMPTETSTQTKKIVTDRNLCKVWWYRSFIRK